MTVFMFPGQGAQIKGMGGDLFPKYPELCDIADKILGYDIKALCLEDPDDLLKNTQYTQPALFIVEALSYLEKNRQGENAEYAIGHSLGEYAALFAASAFDFETGLKLVKKRGELMAQANNGVMLAVINLTEDRINNLLDTYNITSVSIANKNSPKQFVLSGPKEDIMKANKVLSEEALMCIPLNVSGAFHSIYMTDAKSDFESFLSEFTFNEPKKKVIANVNLKKYDSNNIKQNLINQINSPVRWSETITYLKKVGESDFVEIGPGNVLTCLLAQN
jgi:malonyl CoA-acyl carrier protein transacylase